MIFEVEHVIIQRDHFLQVLISLNSSDLHGEDVPWQKSPEFGNAHNG